MTDGAKASQSASFTSKSNDQSPNEGMTVAELIDELKTMPQDMDAEVYECYNDTGELEFVLCPVMLVDIIEKENGSKSVRLK